MDYPTTRWSQIRGATLHGDTMAGKALASFCQSYRQPIICTLRSRGLLEHQLEDVAQDFLLEVMQNSLLRRADPMRGRFRSFLGGVLSRYLCNAIRNGRTLKRGRGLPPLELTENVVEQYCATEQNHSQIVDREWALHLLAGAVEDVAAHWAGRGKSGRFAVMRPFLPGAAVVADANAVMQETGLSESGFRTELSRLRKEFIDAVRSRVACEVDTPAEVEAELAYIYRILCDS
jgi:hypothetical protein